MAVVPRWYISTKTVSTGTGPGGEDQTVPTLWLGPTDPLVKGSSFFETGTKNRFLCYIKAEEADHSTIAARPGAILVNGDLSQTIISLATPYRNALLAEMQVVDPLFTDFPGGWALTDYLIAYLRALVGEGVDLSAYGLA